MEHDTVSALHGGRLVQWPLSLNNDFCTQEHRRTRVNAAVSLTKKPVTLEQGPSLPGEAACP